MNHMNGIATSDIPETEDISDSFCLTVGSVGLPNKDGVGKDDSRTAMAVY